MSRDITLFQFDVDEAAVRRFLSVIPGVTPIPVDERTSPEERDSASAGESAAPADATGVATAGVEEPGSADETVRSAGAEAHLAESGPAGSERAGAKKWTGPSTPWPGAPSQEEGPGGVVDRLRENKLLVGGAVALVGVISAAAVWFLKFRNGGDGADRGRPSDHDQPEREPHADDVESTSYPVDAAPVIGIAFLAVATVALRRLRGIQAPAPATDED
jgi:hypothetical protein